MTLAEAGCKFQDVDLSILTLINIYTAYVVTGNTPLIEMPYEIAEAAVIIERYKSQAGVSRAQEKREREEQREILRGLGITV